MDIKVDIIKSKDNLYPIKECLRFIGVWFFAILLSPLILLDKLSGKKETINEQEDLSNPKEIFRSDNAVISAKLIENAALPDSLNVLDYDEASSVFNIVSKPAISDLHQQYFKFYNILSDKMFLIASNSKDKNLDSIYVIDLKTFESKHIIDTEPFFVTSTNVDNNILTIFGQRNEAKYQVKITST